MNDFERAEQFDRWLAGNPGRHLAALESREIARLLPARYYPVAAKSAPPGSTCSARSTAAARCAWPAPDTRPCRAWWRPISPRCRSASAASTSPCCPHTLDFVDDPHALLRELTEAMVPDGHIVVTGFQPFSVWGLRKWLWLPGEKAPWCGRFFSTGRIQDWLALMGYRVRGGKMIMYRPPVKRAALFDRLAFVEKAGDRWWPMLGAVYLIHAQLETMRMIPVVPLSRSARFKPRLAQGAARRVHLPVDVRRQ
ncbi:MAG: hypothetical protein M5U09_17440 [Gammaproteobacteria bacterium]|nr:hypothetical protein [Gammaproteobacteria bacterium]